MGAICRIVLRYGIGVVTGWLVAKGLLPEEVASQINGSEEVLTQAQLGLCVGAGACVELFYGIAKKNGWSL